MRLPLAAAAAFIAFSAPLPAADLNSTMLLYQAQEPGVGSYPSRILITEQAVRMDDGDNEADYLVFDRKRLLISSVSHGDQTVFEIPSREIAQKPPVALKRRSEAVAVKDVPEVGGKPPQQHRLYVNGALCYSVVAVPGLLDDAVAALSEFRRVLAGEHAKALPHMPADVQEPCDLALNTFHPGWQLQFGLPIREWDELGNGQLLMDFKESFPVDASLFELPKGYRHYSTDSL